MKAIPFFIGLLIMTLNLFGQQEWAPIGASWHQNVAVSEDEQSPDFFPLIDYTVIVSTGDTLVNGLMLRQVGDYLTYQDNDKIYLWWDGSLNLMYDFGVVEGDTVIFNLLSCQNEIITLGYTVNSTSFIEVNGQQLKTVTCHNLPYEPYFGSPEVYTYTEKIGTETFIGNSANCISIPGYFPAWTRCYTDDDIDYKTERFLSHGDFACDYQGVTAVKGAVATNFEIFPNPTMSEVIISGEGYFDISLYNLEGKKIFNQMDVDKQITIDVNHYPKGMYYIKIEKENQLVTKKVVKL